VQESLAALLRRDVDIVDLSAASTVFQMQVLVNGVAIGVADEDRRGHSKTACSRRTHASTTSAARSSPTFDGPDVSTVDDVVVNKSAIVERCVARVREEYADDEQNLTGQQRCQDSIILNL
jgi:hypothetical protein